MPDDIEKLKKTVAAIKKVKDAAIKEKGKREKEEEKKG